MMKNVTLPKFGINKLTLMLFALICVTFYFWAWDKAPTLSTLFPSLEQFRLVSPGSSSKGLPGTLSRNDNKSDNGSFQLINSTQGSSLTGDSFGIEKSNHEFKEYFLSIRSDILIHCNYAKGRWVADRRRPLYSGSGCKQWLSVMWACRLMQRTDFSFEGYRWQPQGCEMPEFSGQEFLRRMQHKTIAFVGDSLGRQQFQSLMCMVTSGIEEPTVEDAGKEYGLVKAPGAKRPDGWVYHFPSTNTTILYYWSASLCELERLNASDPATHYALHLDRPATFIRRYLNKFDVLVLNTGHHWNRGKFDGNRWDMYTDGVPNTNGDLADIRNAKNLTIYSIVNWLNSQFSQNPRIKVFFRTMSPRHFVNGDWNTGGKCDNTIPLANGSEVLQDVSDDSVIDSAVKGTRVKILAITALSKLRDEGHISKYFSKSPNGIQDCLHWCLPGIPDTWNEILCAQL